jgi:DNA polymerase III subunit delta'
MNPPMPSLSELAHKQKAIQLLQRSLERGRLGHAYCFVGDHEEMLVEVTRALAQALNCRQPPRRGASGIGLEGCGACANCRKVAEDMHPDIQWVRPESKSRIITIDQVRVLLQEIHLKPLEAGFKVGVLVAADRLNDQAANAFLKTLEEPPPNSLFVLLTAHPEKVMETILSRCLRLSFSDLHTPGAMAEHSTWVKAFSEMALRSQKNWLGRYQLLGLLLANLAARKEQIEKNLASRSPLEKYAEIESQLREQWQDELAAAIEAEYRRQRAEVLVALQWWLRDVWLMTLSSEADLLAFPELAPATRSMSSRVTTDEAAENLKTIERSCRLLDTNVQEALTLEVGLLQLIL